MEEEQKHSKRIVYGQTMNCETAAVGLIKMFRVCIQVCNITNKGLFCPILPCYEPINNDIKLVFTKSLNDHWRLSPKPPELAGFYVICVRATE